MNTIGISTSGTNPALSNHLRVPNQQFLPARLSSGYKNAAFLRFAAA